MKQYILTALFFFVALFSVSAQEPAPAKLLFPPGGVKTNGDLVKVLVQLEIEWPANEAAKAYRVGFHPDGRVYGTMYNWTTVTYNVQNLTTITMRKANHGNAKITFSPDFTSCKVEDFKGSRNFTATVVKK